MRDDAPDLRPLTSIRGIAAWAVVLFHIRASLALPDPVIAALAKGYLAVDLFFMLSGFVLWLNYAERLREDGLRGAPAFLWRRVARIWPLHLFVLAGGVGFAILLAATGRADPAMYSFAELPLHVLLVQNWGFTEALSWNHPAWSISCELAAYLLFPLLCLTVDWRRAPTGVLVALLAGLAGVLHGVFALTGHSQLGVAIPRLGLARCLIEFAMGTILCVLWRRRAWSGFVMLSGMALAGGLWGAAETLVAPLGFAAVLLLLALTSERPGNPLNARLFVWLGEISYSTYLVHFLLWVGFKLVFVREVAEVSWGMIGLFLALTLAASEALHRWVEAPAQRGLRRLTPPPFAFGERSPSPSGRI